jgi:hypothetical protein
VLDLLDIFIPLELNYILKKEGIEELLYSPPVITNINNTI